jgi:CRISPR-associated endonuclease Csn1
MGKKILGLDLGTNSIGWALVDQDFEKEEGKILAMGSRIIPMTQDIKDEFGKGNSVSQTADRTRFRSVRRLRERHLLRRERLHRVLNVLGFLPEHYASQIDFEKRLGKFLGESEPKLPYNNREFLFKNSFAEMMEDFAKSQPELLSRKNRNGDNAKIPYDWTIYYLRKKALTQKIGKEELAWLILNFNQKRGYYQLRGEDDENSKNIAEYVISSKITSIEKGEKDRKNEKRNWYKIHLANGWVYSATFTGEPEWLNLENEFLVIEELDEDGNVKIVRDKKTDSSGKEKRKITPLPSFEEIDLMSKNDQDKIYKKIKAKTEATISNTGKTVGTYIYDTLLKNPNQKIKGKLVRTIERKFYKEELKSILEKQIELQPELFTESIFTDCIGELYKNNEAHQSTLGHRDFVYLFIDDIIFYQRPLKSQKSSIGNCSLEYRIYNVIKKDTKGNLLKDDNGRFIFEKDENGNPRKIKEYLKCIPKSHPLYQEFRLWQWLYNLKIYSRNEDVDLTSDFINSQEDLENLFDFLNDRKEVNHKDVLTYILTPIIKTRYPDAKPSELNKEIGKEISKYRWNYVFDDSKEKEEEKSKKYPCNETRTQIISRLSRFVDNPEKFLSPEKELQLWHIIYSVTDKKEFEKALKTFAHKNQLDEISFVENFKKFPPFKSEYGAYSEKALRKLLPLMRLGKYWNGETIVSNSSNYFKNIKFLIEKLESSSEAISQKEKDEFNKSINIKLYDELKRFQNADVNSFQGLRLHIAQYLVYGRHSEAETASKWNSVEDLAEYLKEFKQHSLRNPIVEQVVTETLRVVKDIWKHFGNGSVGFFNEIHVELGREMKNTADDRKQMTSQVHENENTNLRIKAILVELMNDADVENVRPYSPMQQEALKIYEDGVLNSGVEIPEFVSEIIKKFKESDIKKQPTSAEINRYKLWLEQKYKSPYTGQIIPLNKLFTDAYQIEHIIPQARYFDDSFSNKIICESSVNGLKDKQLGFEFIKAHAGEKVQDGDKIYEILTEEKYKEFVNEHYKNNRSKRNKLLMDEIPDKMIERQMNDTRYISKFVSNVLSNIVRADTNDEGVNSKNVLPGNGKITSILKQDWGLNDVWNDLILPRFERMNALTQSNDFTSQNRQGHTIPNIPLQLSKGFQKKRIDHRHHAMDALVVACATRDHINLLNNQWAKSDVARYDLQRKLRKTEKYFNQKENREKEKFTEFKKPWEAFTQDAKNELENIIVSFKQNLRVINKTTNTYEKYLHKNGKMVKELINQTKGESWAIRKPMHKDTVSGKINLPRIKVPAGKILTATRKFINTSFNAKSIESITDTGIQKILLNYLNYKGSPELAFSPEGLEELNNHIEKFNDGKSHQPINKVRIFELGSKFELGQTGNKKEKYVEAAKGTNLFFAVYHDENGKRSFETIPLNIVIEREKQGLPPVELKDNKDFYLSPNDLIYLPTEDELENTEGIDFQNLLPSQLSSLFKIVSFTGNRLYVIPLSVATVIVNKIEYTLLNKIELTKEKDICIKLKVDRLGNISKDK